MARISARKKVIKDIAEKILNSKEDPFKILQEVSHDKLAHLTSQDVRELMSVREKK